MDAEKRHANATTTPETRRYIQTSEKSVRALARELGITETTVRRWRRRRSVDDRSHRPHRMQTTLSRAQEGLVLALRTLALLPLDDLLAVVRRFVHPGCSRSGLGRCLRRHGVSALAQLTPVDTGGQALTMDGPGTMRLLAIPVSLAGASYVIAAVDQATRWLYVDVVADADGAVWLEGLLETCPFRVAVALVDGDVVLRCFYRDDPATDGPVFERLCAHYSIKARWLAQSLTPAVETLTDAVATLLAQGGIRTADDLRAALTPRVEAFNHEMELQALGGLSPLGALAQWYRDAPDRFVRAPEAAGK